MVRERGGTDCERPEETGWPRSSGETSPPRSTASWQLPGPDRHRLEKYERAREPHVTSPSLLSPLLASHPLLTMPTNGLLRQRH
jgi:hypothetical protein